jgi:hypothetical protein
MEDEATAPGAIVPAPENVACWVAWERGVLEADGLGVSAKTTGRPNATRSLPFAALTHASVDLRRAGDTFAFATASDVQRYPGCLPREATLLLVATLRSRGVEVEERVAEKPERVVIIPPVPDEGTPSPRVSAWALALAALSLGQLVLAMVIQFVAPDTPPLICLYIGVLLAVVASFDFAWLDRRSLRQRGERAPTIAWCLLSWWAYLFRRAAIRRQASSLDWSVPVLSIGAVIIVAVLALPILAAVQGAAGGSSDYATGIERSITTTGAMLLQEKVTSAVGADATAVVDDVRCRQLARTEAYTCVGHYTVSDPGLAFHQEYLWNITASCDRTGECRWHATRASPISS